jgi:Phosphate-selective porin O and P
MRGITSFTLIGLFLIVLSIFPVYGNDENSGDRFKSRTTLGGYGELHYNVSKKEDSEASKTLDFHRFVLFFSHAWSEKWSFKAELELEHNFVSEGQGELELEQAYINYQASEGFGFSVGVVLPSVGLINERHEPPLFMSVERPDYAKNIIPTTWFGNGASIHGRFSNFNYKFTVMEGLIGEKFSLSSGIRGGRQKGFKAVADSLLYNFSLEYDGILGFLVGGSFSYNNPTIDGETRSDVTIAEAHMKYDANGIYSVFEIGNISHSEGNLQGSFGYYFDLGYNIGRLLNIRTAIYPWFRWTQYNTADKTLEGGDSEEAYKISKFLVGVTVKPISNVVFKAEYGVAKKGIDKTKTTVFNLGAGYMF